MAPVEATTSARFSLKPRVKKPSFTVVVDNFGARADWSRIILESFPAKTVLSVNLNFPLNADCLAMATDFGFFLAASVDERALDRFEALKRAIGGLNGAIKKRDKTRKLSGLVVRRAPAEENFANALAKTKAWLAANGMWLIYADTERISPRDDLPKGTRVPNGFVSPDDAAAHAKAMADFTLNQGLDDGQGVMLVTPAKKHLRPLAEWLRDNRERIALVE